jgi:DNA-binding CsgD family transcriptional regulator
LEFVPPRLHPLIAAANRGDDIAPTVDAISRSFGFDGFLYAVSLSARPNTETRNYVYCTWPPEIPKAYDQLSLVEVDPRIEDLLESVVPRVWDQKTYRGRSPRVEEFLDMMQAGGLASGIVCPIRDMRGRSAMLSLSSGVPINDEVRKSTITHSMGDIMLFGLFFHELFIGGVLNETIPPFLQGGKLSRRECQCLQMAARGLGNEDIAIKLSIAPRTIQHHFDSIRGKLAAASRAEAVAIGLKTGMISL